MRRALKRLASAAALVALSPQPWAQRVVPPPPAFASEPGRSAEAFSGTLVVTPDADWRAKWDTPASTAPDFHDTDSVRKGQQVFILTFFSHPKTGPSGEARIDCDIDIERPDHTHSTQQSNVACYRGTLKGGLDNVYLSSAVIGFLAQPSDLSGLWTVNVSLKDGWGNVVLPLRTTFKLE